MSTPCPKSKCPGTLRKQVNVIVEADWANQRLGKTGLRARDVVVLGVDWERESEPYCSVCGRRKKGGRRG